MYYISMYLEFMNVFLTVDAFADYYSMTRYEAERVIRCGREMHEASISKEVA